ncbi:hypothetical protein JCGZ_05841 [Jatropha curcas]|uniref:UspA domain-containing protein n=1 Tax=Jatropha curcas TaxID=180498 RepID=A0A067J8P2_JATCU|nr:uncharacterized protein LOC105650637 [Jatropha curcas]KDP20072.1 hypothetical protein JCGZ_05841 [Jatropha curcas]
MDGRKIVVVVEDVEAARTALEWALHNLLRFGDLITLLHVFSPSKSRNRKKIRLLRLQGYQLALSFKEICNTFFNTNIEIIVTEGDQEGGRIAAMVREIGAFALVVGLHDQSFLYRWAMAHNNAANNFSCKVLAIKQPAAMPPLRTKGTPTIIVDSSTNMDFSQIEIARLEVPNIPPPKVPYKIWPDPSAVIWRWRKPRRKKTGS